jgi:y4mF family transcriptional regulator
MKKDRNNDIARFLRQQRKASGVTQQQLADMAGVGLRLLRDVEQGRLNLQMEKVNLLLSFYGHELGPVPMKKTKES